MPTKQKSDAKKNTTAEKSSEEMLDSVFARMSTNYAIPKNQISDILRKTAFKVESGETIATEAEMVALLSVAEKYDLNPFIKEIFAFRNKKGVLQPIISVDGWIKIMNNHPKFDGFDFNYSDNMITIGKSKPCFEWMEIIIHRTDRRHSVVIREYLDECYIQRSFASPWDTHTKRMLRHKNISQGVRVAFGVNEAVDLDEAHRIDDALAAEINRKSELEKPENAENVSTEVETVEPIPRGDKDIETGKAIVDADIVDDMQNIGTDDSVVPNIEPDAILEPPPQTEQELNIFQDTPAPTQEKTPEDKPVTTNEDEVPDLF